MAKTWLVVFSRREEGTRGFLGYGQSLTSRKVDVARLGAVEGCRDSLGVLLTLVGLASGLMARGALRIAEKELNERNENVWIYLSQSRIEFGSYWKCFGSFMLNQVGSISFYAWQQPSKKCIWCKLLHIRAAQNFWGLIHQSPNWRLDQIVKLCQVLGPFMMIFDHVCIAPKTSTLPTSVVFEALQTWLNVHRETWNFVHLHILVQSPVWGLRNETPKILGSPIIQ